MTAIPAARGSTALVLICDHCGRVFEDRVVHTVWRLLWTHAVAHGWCGRDRAVGPHCCARCAGEA
ncbi:hypothetical protein ACFXGA_11125 [Actinosynnema sp. NPDC059335]|uniref:hypothetical protein n=1 Tax=Actinosynnema sp. NPDC059335 TaxID=3346804 RepID=UPI00366B484E